MECLQIVGGNRLTGRVQASGAKNSALPILAASILAEGPVRLLGVPKLLDVETQRLVLSDLGVRSTWESDDALLIETEEPSRCRADHRWVSRMRASFCVLGPLLASRGKATVALPGGCNLGMRPVDLHLRAFERLGAEFTLVHGYLVATAKRLRGCSIDMRGPYGTTVTGTANILCAAVRAEGITEIIGAAREPEIQDLGRFLQCLGAKIEGLGTETITVYGQQSLGGTTYRIIPDRIEAGTFLLAAVAAGGSICVEGVHSSELTAVLTVLDELGAHLEVFPDRVAIQVESRMRGIELATAPYPGFPTDLQAPLMAVLALAEGPSRITEAVFPQRLMHVAELCRLGAKITVSGSTAAIDKTRPLSGARVVATNLRAAAALAIAGLAAQGRTCVSGTEHLDRGYVRFEQKLRQLGACISRGTLAPPDPLYAGIHAA